MLKPAQILKTTFCTHFFILTWVSILSSKSEVVEVKEGEEAPPQKPEEQLGEDQIEIEDLREYHTENTVHFVVVVSEEMMEKAEAYGLERMFGTRKTGLPTTNMVCFDANSCVSKYLTPLEILSDFANVRMEYYPKI